MGTRKDRLTERQKKGLSIAAFAIFVLFSALVGWFIGRPMVRLASKPDQFRLWVHTKGTLGKVIFVGMVILQVFVALIPGEPLELGAGYAFGAWEGTLLCMIGLTIGSMLVFLFVRYCGVKAVEVFFSHEKIQSLRFLQNERKLGVLLFVAFLIPGTPKDLLCYFAGLTEIRFSHFFWITLIARLPSVLTSTIGGNALGVQNYTFAVVMLAITVVISAVGLVIYRRICRRKQKREE